MSDTIDPQALIADMGRRARAAGLIVAGLPSNTRSAALVAAAAHCAPRRARFWRPMLWIWHTGGK
jgi:hypothetical protein